MTDVHGVRISGDERVVECAGEQAVLDACLRAGRWLPHSCTQGTCGSCKMRVVSGEVDHRGTSDYTLPAEERAAGIALACQATPRSDLHLEPVEPIDDDAPHHPLRDHTGTVVELADIARETRRIVVELDEPMTFDAGQYAEITVPGTGLSRQYSMANPPWEQRFLEFHVRRTPGGAATDGWMFRTLRCGDPVELTGSLGDFGLRAQEEPAILIAGGTGLAPLKSIVQDALARDLAPQLHLYHGGRTEDDLYDVAFFRDLAAEHPALTYRPCLSESTWDGAVGLVTDVVAEDFPSCRGMSAYLCGPPAMIEAGGKVLKKRRMAPRRIHREKFLDASHAA